MNPTVLAAGPVPDVDLAKRRPVGVFFAGSTNPRDYDREVLRKRYHALTRLEMLDTLLSTPGMPRPRRLRTPEDAASLTAGGEIVLSIDGGCRIPQRDWLRTIALADFWLACPGTQMPMCHNLVEALAVGTIPILEYERYTTPELVDGVNCLVFRGERGLVETLFRALATPEVERLRMRRAARDFYERHHAPGAFVRRLLSAAERPTRLLLNDHLAARPVEPAARSIRAAA